MGAELVVFVGLQASGKSSFYRERFAATHVLVSKDLFRNARQPSQRQHTLVEEALANGRSVVVDNTNPTVEDRLPLIAQARTHGARVSGYYFKSVVSECLVRNAGRQGKAQVPEVALFSTIKKMVRPSLPEGFDELFYVSLADRSFIVSDWQMAEGSNADR